MSDQLVPRPAFGRIFQRERRVRLGDASPAGRLRFDALARYLQDVSNDDTRDAGLDDEMGWVVRRTAIEVQQFPVFGEELTLATWCGGTGGRWAERRVSVTGSDGGHIEAATLWVHLAVDTLRPAPLSPQFMALFGEAAGGRTVRARLEHDDPPTDATGREWPTRFADFDVLGHMNNAAYWETVEQELARRRDLRAPLRAELEFRHQIEPDHVVTLAVDDAGPLSIWLTGASGVFASAMVRPLFV